VKGLSDSHFPARQRGEDAKQQEQHRDCDLDIVGDGQHVERYRRFYWVSDLA
jgi:hypothetical protein